MKKRIVCVLLTLIMLMSLVPMSASAAGSKISEAAITVLKQLEGYNTKCNANGYTGYGTVCKEKGTHGDHVISEKKADAALREKLEELDEAVNSFASKKGISLSQSKHDAMVLFSFENGTAWTSGTGDLQAAIASGKTGSEFLNAICWWDNSTADDYRRMVEANMYLNGVYSSAKPSQFIRVTFDANGGTLNKAQHQYFDVTSAQAINFEPTQAYHQFMGWYTAPNAGSRVTSLNSAYTGATLYAHWQAFSDEAMDWDNANYSNVSYNMYAKDLASDTVYMLPNGMQTKSIATGYIKINCEFVDDNGNRWGRLVDNTTGAKIGWVLLKNVSGSSASNSNGVAMEVTVTVTNSYVNRRVNATSASAKNGSYSQGKQLLIINEDDGWGQVGEYQDDGSIKAVGWVYLIYTNWDSVSDQAAGTSSVTIATATITYNGYVNVRADAGTNNKIVGALPTGTTVELYETKYVNGLQWGRCKTGWLCLAYAEVSGLNQDDSKISDVGFTSYAFTGRLTDIGVIIYSAPSMSAEVVRAKDLLDPNVTITRLTSAEGYTWGKFSKGWIRVTDNTTYAPVDVDLDTAKFYVTADSLTVRENPVTASKRIDSLIKGVEFDVNRSHQIIVVGETIWGFADKVGEDNRTYNGWVNLANKNVSRNGAPTIEGDKTDIITNKMATVINTNNLKVRKTGATYGAQIGTLTQGTTVAVWEENNGWYKVDSNKNGTYDYEGDGWVSGQYLNVFDSTSDNSTSNGTSNGTGTVQTGMGVVANTYSGVNVRQGAGTGYALVGKLLPGTAVEILEVKTVGAGRWGRTTQGWVSMDYITMVSNYEIAGTAGTTGSSTSGTVTEAEDAIYTGTTKTNVTVYKEPSLKADAVRELAAGAPITLHEIRTVEETVTSTTSDSSTGSTTTTEKVTSYWARVNDGYIYAPADNINLDTVDEHTYTMTGTDKLNVRNNPGTSGTNVVDKLVKGDQVTITNLQIVNGNVWGKAEYEDEEGQLAEGWVSLKYMSKGAITIVDESQNNNNNTNNNTTTPPVVMGNGSSTGGFVTNTSGYRYTGKVIRTNELNVRSTPSTTASKTTTLTSGQALVIYETTTAENMAWGRCDAGWVYLYYVDLTPVTGAVDARVVYNDNTVIYTDMNCTGTAGTYARMAVIDIFEIVGKMARTELGWVNTDNLL